jgi:hypothetical protein
MRHGTWLNSSFETIAGTLTAIHSERSPVTSFAPSVPNGASFETFAEAGGAITALVLAER